MIRIWSIRHLSQNDSTSVMAQAQFRGSWHPWARKSMVHVHRLLGWHVAVLWRSLWEQAQQSKTKQYYTLEVITSGCKGVIRNIHMDTAMECTDSVSPRQEALESPNHLINNTQGVPHMPPEPPSAQGSKGAHLLLATAVIFLLKQWQARPLAGMHCPSADFSELCWFKWQDSGLISPRWYWKWRRAGPAKSLSLFSHRGYGLSHSWLPANTLLWAVLDSRRADEVQQSHLANIQVRQSLLELHIHSNKEPKLQGSGPTISCYHKRVKPLN